MPRSSVAAISAKMMSRAGFYTLLNNIRPARYDLMTKVSRARTLKDDSVNYLTFNRDRFYQTVSAAFSLTDAAAPVICDMGVFPGGLIHILAEYSKTVNRRPEFHGAGISITEEFTAYMRERYSARTYTVNFDPANPDFKDKHYLTRTPLADGSVDIVFATEIIEHLLNPIPMLEEAYRILKPGGVAVVTSPNITRIGNLFKLAAGISTNDRLIPAGYSNPDDEWRPHAREYSMKELADLLSASGFEIAQKTYFIGDQTVFNKKDFKQRLIDCCKIPFHVIPHFRGYLLIAARKR